MSAPQKVKEALSRAAVEVHEAMGWGATDTELRAWIEAEIELADQEGGDGNG